MFEELVECHISSLKVIFFFVCLAKKCPKDGGLPCQFQTATKKLVLLTATSHEGHFSKSRGSEIRFFSNFGKFQQFFGNYDVDKLTLWGSTLGVGNNVAN